VVVNNDPTQLQVLAELVRQAGLEPVAFPGAEAALTALNPDAPPALIVTDVYMPDLDGWRFCRLLRSPEYAAFNDVPILVVSATFSGDEPARIAADLGAEAFLSAPVDGPEFIEQIHAILLGKKARNLPRILIVEDEPELANMLADIFSVAGYRTDTVSAVRQAAVAIAGTAYDMAVMDYHLSDGRSDVLLEQFQAEQPHCVCIMMTGDRAPELSLNLMKRGADAFVGKPFEPDYLLDLCARARRERALLRLPKLLESRTRELQTHQRALEKQNQELQSTQANLSASRARYIDLYDFAPVGYATIGTNGRILEANRTAAALLNVPRNALLQQPFSQFILTEDQTLYCQYRDTLFETGAPQTCELRMVRAGKPPFWADLEATAAQEANGGPVCRVVMSDITAHKRTEEELSGLRSSLYHADRVGRAGEIAMSLAHELNQPLTGIMTNAQAAQMLLAGEQPDLNELQSILDDIVADDKRAGDVIRQLRSFLKKQPPVRDWIDINGMVLDLLRILRADSALRDVSVVTALSEDLPKLHADRVQLQQVLLNLIVNAEQAMVHQPAAERTIVVSTARGAPDEVIFSVQDTGPGVDKEGLEKLFEAFHTTKPDGMGIGLSICRSIIEAHGGRIWAENNPDRGATVSVALPKTPQKA
jgi:PAS domain S-box-containing protein